MYGEWDPSGGYAGVSSYANSAATDSRWDQFLNELGLWISPGRGLLILTPAVIALLPALIRSWRLMPEWVKSLALGGLAYAMIQGLLNYFAGGAGFFGYRLTLEVLACMFPALAISVRRAGRLARATLPSVIAVQMGIYGFGAARDGFTMAPTDAWRVNSVVWAVSTVPAFGLMLLLMGALAVLVVRVAPSTWAWPSDTSAPQQAHQRG